MMLAFVLYFVLAVIICLDGYTTVKGLKNPSTYEANRPVAWLMSKIGVKPALLGLISIQIIATLPLALWAPQLSFLYIPLILWRGYVVRNNFRILAQNK